MECPLMYNFLYKGLGIKENSYPNYKINYGENNVTFKNFFLNKKKQIVVIKSKSRHEYGYKVGKYFKLEYNLLSKIIDILKNDMLNHKILERYLDKKNYDLSSNQKYYEFEGLSDATNIKIERLIYLHKLFLVLFGSNCTNMLATGKATKHHNAFLIQNLDGGLLLTILVRLFTYKLWMNASYNSLKYIYFGIPVLLETPIINQEGLGHGQTATICNKKRYNRDMRRKGVYINILISDTMKKCKTVNEVSELWNNTKIGYGKVGDQLLQSTMWCDKKGDILSIENGPDSIATVFRDSTEITGEKEGIIWHARHHQWLDGRKTGAYIPSECYYSILNANRAKELLKMHYGNIDIETCKKIASDHGKEKDDGLCKHPDRDRAIFTCCSYIINPEKKLVYLTHGSPCKSKFIEYDFSKKFVL